MSNDARTIEPGAVISACGRYRYKLTRSWAPEPRYLMWVMLNPSTADASKDDPTIRRCVGFAKALGYTGIVVGNLYALRATDPKVLRHPPGGIDAVGPENDAWLCRMAQSVDMIICAWGQRGPDRTRVQDVLGVMPSHKLHTMGFTKSGEPRHPLMLPSATRPAYWPETSAA